MKRKGICTLLIFFVLITSCDAPVHHNKSDNIMINDLNRLQGSWAQPTDNGTLSETWKKINDTLLTGIGCLVFEKDTLFSERLRIYKNKGFWYYSAQVTDQNEGETIVFKLTSHENSAWVFENKAHDFPQNIHYQIINPDSLIATVTGKGKNGPRTEIFRMNKK